MQTTIRLADLVPSDLQASERGTLGRRARHAVCFGVLDGRASAHFDDSASARYFHERYCDLRKDEPPARPTYAVRDDAGRVHFWSEDDSAYMWPHGALSPSATAFFADAFATHALFSSIPSVIALHAAALRRNDVAFALTGLSTAGKSTTALACVAAGAQLYSDERCVTTPQGAIAYPRTLNVRRGGIELLLDSLPACALRLRLAEHRGCDWNSVPFAEIFGASPLPEPAPLRAIFAIVGRDAVPRSRAIERAAMLPLAEPGAQVWARGIERVCALLALFGRVACFELVLGTPMETAEHVLARVDELGAA
jgi:hypothetical protein